MREIFGANSHIRAANLEAEIHIYNAGHGFDCDQRGSFDEASCKNARERTLEYYRKPLGWDPARCDDATMSSRHFLLSVHRAVAGVGLDDGTAHSRRRVIALARANACPRLVYAS